VSRNEDALSPTYLAMGMRRQLSGYHIFEATDLYVGCGRCGFRWNHPDHISRDEDRAEVRRWADRIAAERE
jgi:hypothetical protein